MPLENNADRLVGNCVPEIGQCADDPIMTPTGFSRVNCNTSCSISAARLVIAVVRKIPFAGD
jgi:hypothetical protein